jgi:CheY-like chemotaxis protein
VERSLYDLAEVLVFDPIAANRAATRSALYSLGCRQIEIVGNLRDFFEALENRPPDLALCEAQPDEAELCRAIRELRQSEQSYNPFAIIIVTAWTPSAAVATDIMNAGADGLILRPFSAALLDQKFRTHVLHRKPFVVTDSYVGPERRAAVRSIGSFSIAPPNSLKMKIDGRSNLNEAIRHFNRDLQAACAKLVDAKQRRKSCELQD